MTTAPENPSTGPMPDAERDERTDALEKLTGDSPADVGEVPPRPGPQAAVPDKAASDEITGADEE